MNSDMRQALDERQVLIEQRAATVLDTAIANGEPWTTQLGPKPEEPRQQATWFRAARAIAAYRDRYQIVDDQHPLGPGSEDLNVKRRVAEARAQIALSRVQHDARITERRDPRPSEHMSHGHTL